MAKLHLLFKDNSRKFSVLANLQVDSFCVGNARILEGVYVHQVARLAAKLDRAIPGRSPLLVEKRVIVADKVPN